jgi:hypothetical protein
MLISKNNNSFILKIYLLCTVKLFHSKSILVEMQKNLTIFFAVPALAANKRWVFVPDASGNFPFRPIPFWVRR